LRLGGINNVRPHHAHTENEEELSAEEQQKLWGFVERYLEEVAPIHWLNWHGRCQDDAAKERVSAVLFYDGHLRDVTDPVVKQEVLETVRHEPAMMQLVISDLAEEVEKHDNNDPAALPCAPVNGSPIDLGEIPLKATGAVPSPPPK
jgi:hypothetical protein